MLLVAAYFLSGNLSIATEEEGGTTTDARRARNLIEQISAKTRAEEFILVEASPGATDPTQLNAVMQDIVGKVRVLDNTHDNSGSVVYGLYFTASIITGAALIMVSVFGGFALGPRAMFQ